MATDVDVDRAADTAARRPTVWIAVALILGLLLGSALGFLAPRLAGGTPGDDSPEAGFARDMTAHHAQAVEMGMIEYAQGANAEARFMGRDIALTQQGQIGMMQAWLREWNLGPTGTKPPMAWMPSTAGSAAGSAAGSVRDGLMPGMATPAQLAQLRAAKGAAADRLFTELMIQHHLGGIHMAQEIVKLSDDAEVIESAEIAINGQQRELTDMRNLQKQLPAA